MENYKEWLIKRFLIERKKFDRSGVYAYTQRAMAYNSNKIEGSTLTPEQTASLFDTGTLPKSDDYYRAKDVEEMNGHFLMFNYMLDTLDDELSQDLIKRFHYELKSGVLKIERMGMQLEIIKNVRTWSECIQLYGQKKFQQKWKGCWHGITVRKKRFRCLQSFMPDMNPFILSGW